MRLGKGKKRWLVGLGLVAGAVLLIWVAAPVWFPWVLGPLAHKAGIGFAQYERRGYSHFVVREVGFTNEDVQLRVGKAEILVPTAWLWRWRMGRGEATEPFVRVEDWELGFVTTTNNTSGGGEGSVYTNAMDVADVLKVVERWVPMAAISNGMIRIGKTEVAFPSATWNRGNLAGMIGFPQQRQQATFTATLHGGLPCVMRVQSEALQLQSDIQISSAGGGLTLQTTNVWRTNRIEFAAQFGARGVLPEKATLEAADFRFPAELIQLPDYEEVRGTVEANWARGEFGVKVEAEAIPLKTSSNAPLARLDLRARGDTNAATIESAVVSSPWLRAELSKELRIHFTEPWLSEPGTFKVEAELDHQPWIALHGRLNGEADLRAGSGKFPEVHFRLGGTNVGNAILDAKTFAIRGEMEWPALKIGKAEAVFDDGSRAETTGSFDWETKTIGGGHLQFSGPMGNRWLSAGYGYENLALSAEFSGPLDKLAHGGRLMVTNCSLPRTKVLQMAVDWKGEKVGVSRAEVVVSSGGQGTRPHPGPTRTTQDLPDSSGSPQEREQKGGEATLVAVLSGELAWGGQTSQPSRTGQTGAGASGGEKARLHPPPLRSGAIQERGETGARQFSIRLQSLTLKQGGEAVLELEKESRISFRPISTNKWSAGIHDFHWRGRGGDLEADAEVEWPRTGITRVTVTNTHSELLDSFLKEPMEPFEVQKLVGVAGWTNGAVSFRVEAEAKLQESTNNSQKLIANSQGVGEWEGLRAEVRVGGDGAGMWITNLVVASQTSNVAVARGFLPITLNPVNRTNFVELGTDKSVDLKLNTEPNSIFWQKLAKWTGLVLTEPSLQAEVAGSWAAPRGSVHVSAEKIQMPRTNSRLPVVEHLVLELGLDRRMAILTNLSLLVQGQPVRATGEFPLGDAFWADVRAKKIPSWEKATGQVAIENAQISAFAKLFPALLAPQGEFSLKASLAPGANLDGELTVRHASMRPLPSVGVIRDIEVALKFMGRKVALQRSTAAIGGSTIVATGEGDLSGTEWLKGVPPPFEFKLVSTNVPLSRRPESIIRSDLDLTVRKTNGAPPLISGTARLRDSYYLSDIADLAPGRTASVQGRPPYFSIDEPGLGDWRLAIHVTGERGLSVRSTLFNGKVTPNLRLQGTLQEPLAIGDVKIDAGTVKFPFADLEIQRGYITLTSEDPYRPRLMVMATSRQFGYDVKMEMTGPADQPVIQFNSTPALSSEQLILMVTAGELPKGGYTLNPTQRGQTMALFLGKDMLSKLGFGDQAEERLTFSSGQDISETGKPTYNLEYKLKENWSVVGEYDRFNALNAGLKWRIYSK